MKKCPFCAEEILQDAKKCRYCGEWLDGAGKVIPQAGTKPARKGNSITSEIFKWIGILWSILYIVMAVSCVFNVGVSEQEAAKRTVLEVKNEMMLMAGIWLAIAGPAFLVFAFTKRK